MVAMIEAPFRTALMPAPGGTDRGAPGVLSARARAVRMSAITGGTNREEVATATTGLLAEGWLHGVGVRARTSDWTSRRNRGTTDTTGSNGRSSRRSRGSGGHPGPHLRVLRRPYLSRTTGLRPRRGLWTLTPLWTHASTSGLENCSAVSHKRPQPSSSSIQSLKNTAPSSSYPSTPGQVSALSNGQRHPSKGSPPSAAQTVRAVFPHTAFTRLARGREMEGVNEWTFCSPVGLSQSASLLG